VYAVTDQLHQSDIMRILSNPDTSRISDVPPAKPKTNEVYLVRSKNENDWKCDQFVSNMGSGNSSV
jgi:hypothetical protein